MKNLSISSLRSIRILSLGDSYTIGEGVEPSERWPIQLVDRLRKLGYAADDPMIIARTGWTTDELIAGIRAAEPQLVRPYDLVTLLIGVNNQYRGYGLAEYRRQFCDLLGLAAAFAGERPRQVLVLSVPDWGVTPFAAGRDRALIAGQIDAFNQVNAEAAAVAGAGYVDITPLTRQAGSSPAWLTEDGLHPSGKQYGEWVDLALPGVLQMLDKRGAS